MTAGQDDDFGWFSPFDFDIVLAAIARHPKQQEIILVGGQSLVGWAIHYKLDIPQTEYPALTRDVDFIGGAKEAEFLAKELDAEFRAASIDDNTPNTAVLTWVSPSTGQKLTVDFLSVLIGLNTDEIKKLAVLMKFSEQQQPVWILHPLLCLKSRFENLLHLKNKRNKNGVTQARIAVEVARMFVLEALGSGNPDEEKIAIKAAHRIADIARSDAGVFVFNEYGIDLMTAVDPSLYRNNPLFALKDWRNHLKWVGVARSKDIKRRQDLHRRSLLPPKDRK